MNSALSSSWALFPFLPQRRALRTRLSEPRLFLPLRSPHPCRGAERQKKATPPGHLVLAPASLPASFGSVAFGLAASEGSGPARPAVTFYSCPARTPGTP